MNGRNYVSAASNHPRRAAVAVVAELAKVQRDAPDGILANSATQGAMSLWNIADPTGL